MVLKLQVSFAVSLSLSPQGDFSNIYFATTTSPGNADSTDVLYLTFWRATNYYTVCFAPTTHFTPAGAVSILLRAAFFPDKPEKG